MKIAFVGKGGAGKTTLAALFARHLAAQGATVWAVDADINQNLAVALGEDADEAALRPALRARRGRGAAGRDRRVRRVRPRGGVLPLEGRRGGADPQPPGRRRRRVR